MIDVDEADKRAHTFQCNCRHTGLTIKDSNALTRSATFGHIDPECVALRNTLRAAAFEAGVREGLERAAKLCDEVSGMPRKAAVDTGDIWRRSAAMSIGTAIRSLAAKENPDGR